MRPITAAASARSSSDGPNTEPDGQAERSGAQDHRDRRDHGRDDPRDVLRAPDVDAEQRRPVGAVGARAQRDAEVGVVEEGEQRADHDEGDDHGDQLVGVEHERVDLEAEVERRGERGRRERGAEQPGDRLGDAGQELGEADGGDHEDQARCAGEAPDHDRLDEPPEDHRRPRARAGTATQYDQPLSVTRHTARVAGTAPRSAWAKLMTRCDR